MADQSTTARELVYCHQCKDEWYRDEHGLVCPECSSEIVEIIEPDSDPRQIDETMDDMGFGPDDEDDDHDHMHAHERPFGGGNNPWASAPDPEEGDIDHVSWNTTGPHPIRVNHSHTIHHSGPLPFPPGGDPFSHFFTSLLGPQMARRAQQQQQQQQQQQGVDREQAGGTQSSSNAPPSEGQEQGSRSPLQEGPFRFASPPRITGGITVTTRGFGPTPTTQQFPIDDLAGIFGTLIAGIGGGPGMPGDNMHGPPHPLGIIGQLLNPANARAGDAVYTNEALDRVISQLMEQHSTSTAPGPATEAAIAALPKRKIGVEDFAENGKAECSICMDELEVGMEVTELPCHHWFHGDCVGAWLREHDTCPQCRRGITPKEGDVNSPRAPGEAPMHWPGGLTQADLMSRGQGQGPQSTDTASQYTAGSNTNNPPGQTSAIMDGTRESPILVPSSPIQPDRRSEGGSSSHSASGSRGSGGFSGSIAGLMGRFRRGSGNGSNNNNNDNDSSENNH